ncbi:ADP,ATP carrier protein [Vairimorpha necatrix]|uniref:ADP,ATP carrier protein n=1 Tax=Vairimorpha necatrix TaxID=6039 RepID=A0AAX4JDT3_9MICR
MIKIRRPRDIKLVLSLIFFVACLGNTLLEFYTDIAIITKQIPSSLYFIKLFLSLPIILITMGLIQKSLYFYKFGTIINFIILFFSLSFLSLSIIYLKYEKSIQKGSLWAVDIFCDGKMKTRGLVGLIPFLYIYSEWVSTLSYLISDLFSSVMIGFAIYTLANYCCTEKDMKDIVPYFSSITAFSMLISVVSIVLKSKYVDESTNSRSFNHNSLFYFVLFFLCTVIYLLKTVLPVNEKEVNSKQEIKTDKQSHGILDLLKSKFLRNMCTAALIYAINAGYIDMTFKNALAAGSKMTNMPPKDYSQKFILTSIITISTVSLIYNFLIRGKFDANGIFFSSMVSPISAIFFSLVISFLALYNLNCPVRYTKINLENWFGAIGYAFSKITKYVLFDMAKEMLSMRISVEYRYKYKSIYDGICLKLGKSIVSFYCTILTFLGFSDIRRVSHFTLLFLMAGNFLWIKSVYYLNEKYKKSIDQNTEIDVEN